MRSIALLALRLAPAIILVVSVPPPPARADLVGPTEYLSFADSPFDEPSLSNFHLETFEDHLFDVPGVVASAGGVTSVVFGVGIIDSVDGDDGAIDGSGLDGDSYFSGGGSEGIEFTFSAAILGTLPTHVGLVWTDGGNSITFEAFDQNGDSLGQLLGDHADDSNSGETGEDRFYGAIHAGGISRIFIRNDAGGIEVDHLQYGGVQAVPEPASIALLGAGGIWLVIRGWRRRRPGRA